MSATEQSRLATGRVVSDKMEKSITVLIERRVKHPIYRQVCESFDLSFMHMMRIMSVTLVI